MILHCVICYWLKVLSKSKLFGECPSCLRTTSATLIYRVVQPLEAPFLFLERIPKSSWATYIFTVFFYLSRMSSHDKMPRFCVQEQTQTQIHKMPNAEKWHKRQHGKWGTGIKRYCKYTNTCIQTPKLANFPKATLDSEVQAFKGGGVLLQDQVSPVRGHHPPTPR